MKNISLKSIIKDFQDSNFSLLFKTKMCNFLSKNGQLNDIHVKNEIVNSYSQYGEDLILDGILEYKKRGFFIDIGANDPVIFNNTKRFYDRGWSGINIEPNPVLYKKFASQRTRDINLNLGVGLNSQEMPFYLLSADTLSSFSKSDAKRNSILFNERIIDIKNIQMVALSQIFKDYSDNRNIDFISVDVEGYEMEVIKSNDWTKYRPRLILIEIAHNTMEIISYLKNCEYELVFKNSTNGIFLDSKKKVTASE